MTILTTAIVCCCKVLVLIYVYCHHVTTQNTAQSAVSIVSCTVYHKYESILVHEDFIFFGSSQNITQSVSAYWACARISIFLLEIEFNLRLQVYSGRFYTYPTPHCVSNLDVGRFLWGTMVRLLDKKRLPIRGARLMTKSHSYSYWFHSLHNGLVGT